MTRLCSSEGWRGHARSLLPAQTHQNQHHHAPQPTQTIPTDPQKPPHNKVIQAQCRKSPNMPNTAGAEQRSVHQPPSSSLGTPKPQTVPCGSTDSFYFPAVSPPAGNTLARLISELNARCRVLGGDERCFLTSNLVNQYKYWPLIKGLR